MAKDNFGFSLLEVILVIAIFVIVVSASIPVYGNWQAATQIDMATADMEDALLTARARSRAGYRDSAHGVYLDIEADGPDGLTIYQGESYALRDMDYDQTLAFGANIVITNVLSNDDINFSRGLGLASATGTINMVFGGVGQSQEVTINSLGIFQ